MDGLLSFWVLSTVFAIVGTALKGLIRPISWGTLAIATLLVAPGKMTETVNAFRAGEVNLSLPSVPPPPPVGSNANPSPVNTASPVPLNPNLTPPDSISSPPPPSAIADKGWTIVDLTAQDALPTGDANRPQTSAANPTTNNPTGSTTEPATRPTTSNPPVSGLW